MKIAELFESKQQNATNVDEKWFGVDSFKTYKNPIPISYEIAKTNCTIDTLEGPIECKRGHVIITGSEGEQYPVSKTKFDQLYTDITDINATPKKIMKTTKLADHDGVIKTDYGNLEYSKNKDYNIRHGKNDYGVVKKSIFKKTYHQPE